MNEQTTPTETPTTTAPARAKRGKSKAPTAVRTRTVDPAVQKIHAEAKAKVAELRKAQSSGAVMNRIVTQLLPKLTAAHLSDLYKIIGQSYAGDIRTHGLPAIEGATTQEAQ